MILNTSNINIERFTEVNELFSVVKRVWVCVFVFVYSSVFVFVICAVFVYVFVYL